MRVTFTELNWDAGEAKEFVRDLEPGQVPRVGDSAVLEAWNDDDDDGIVYKVLEVWWYLQRPQPKATVYISNDLREICHREQIDERNRRRNLAADVYSDDLWKCNGPNCDPRSHYVPWVEAARKEAADVE